MLIVSKIFASELEIPLLRPLKLIAMKYLRIRLDDKRELEVKKSRFSIGSSEDNDLIIPGLAPRHLIIYNIEGKWILIANDSVVLNGRNFRGETEIHDGDRIEIEDHVLEFNLQSKDSAYFRVLSGRDAGKIVTIDRPGIMGRSPTADYRFSDPYVSRIHARVDIRDGEYYIEDLNPKNPILLNNKVLKGSEKLHTGDEIRLGKTRILFVNPNEKPEEALYVVNRKPLYLFGILALILAVFVSTYWYISRRNNLYYEHVSRAKIFASKATGSDDVVNKIKYLNMSLHELKLASKYGDVGNLDDIVQANLEAWQKVMGALELTSQGQVDSARVILKGVAGLIGNNETFDRIYARVQRLSMANQALAVAEKLEKTGMKEEARELRSMAIKYMAYSPSSSSESPEFIGDESEKDDGINLQLDLPAPEEPGHINLESKGLLKEVSYAENAVTAPAAPSMIGAEDISIDIDMDMASSSVVESGNASRKSLASIEGISILELKRLYESGDLNRLIEKARAYLKKKPDNPSAEYYLNVAIREKKARKLEKQGRIQEALKAWSEVLQLDPYNKRAKKAIIELGSR